MRWDELERECLIISRNLDRASRSFAVLAASLHRERKFASDSPTKGDGLTAVSEIIGNILPNVFKLES